MPNYIFLPVKSAEMQRLAQNISGFLSANSAGPITQILTTPYELGWKKGAMRKLGLGCLRSVQPQDILYIVSHGAGYPGSGNIGTQRFDGVLKKYTQEELAEVLKAEGLTTSFRNIHLLTCGSGLMNKNTIAVAPKAAKTLDISQMRDPKLSPLLTHRESVVRQLCNAMKRIGYAGIQVTGYLGEISVRPPNRITIEEYFTKHEMDLSWKIVAR